MSRHKRGLNKGLSALLAGTLSAAKQPVALAKPVAKSVVEPQFQEELKQPAGKTATTITSAAAVDYVEDYATALANTAVLAKVEEAQALATTVEQPSRKVVTQGAESPSRQIVPTMPLVRSSVLSQTFATTNIPATTATPSTTQRTAPRSATPGIEPSQPIVNNNEYRLLAVNKLIPGRFQPRRVIKEEELEELASSIKSQGLLQPIVARPLNAQQYEIVAGERRWRASQLAGLVEVPVIVKTISDEDACAIGLIENIQRQALNPLEEALAVERLIKQFNLTHAEVADAVGKSRVSITNLLRLLNLEAEVKKLLEQSALDVGHAKALLTVSGAKQIEIAKKVAEQQLSVRETEALVNFAGLSRSATAPGTRNQTKALDPDVVRLQRTLSDKFGATVKIQHSAKGRGKLIIHYQNLDVLEGILQYLE